MTWMCAHRTSIAEFDRTSSQVSLELVVWPRICQAVNLMYKVFKDYIVAEKMVPWLLPEDEETMGIQSLHDPVMLSSGCQLSWNSVSREPKPRAVGLDTSSTVGMRAMTTRIHDIYLCTLTLANSACFPGTSLNISCYGDEQDESERCLVDEEPTAPLSPEALQQPIPQPDKQPEVSRLNVLQATPLPSVSGYPPIPVCPGLAEKMRRGWDNYQP